GTPAPLGPPPPSPPPRPATGPAAPPPPGSATPAAVAAHSAGHHRPEDGAGTPPPTLTSGLKCRTAVAQAAGLPAHPDTVPPQSGKETTLPACESSEPAVAGLPAGSPATVIGVRSVRCACPCACPPARFRCRAQVPWACRWLRRRWRTASGKVPGLKPFRR